MAASPAAARRPPLADLDVSTYHSRQDARGADRRAEKEVERADKARAKEAENGRLREAGLALSQAAAAEEARKDDVRARRKAEKKALRQKPTTAAALATQASAGEQGIGTADSAAAQPHAATLPAASPPRGRATPPPPPALFAAPALAAAALDPPLPVAGGRLVWNHSTHVAGLPELLCRLLAEHPGITTVVPGRIKGGLAHRPALELEDFEPLDEGRAGFSCSARKERAAQDVAIVTQPGVSLKSVLEALERAFGRERSCRARLVSGDGSGGSGSSGSSGGGGGGWDSGNPNRGRDEAAEAAVKARQKAKHAELEAAAKGAALEKKAHTLERKLRASAASKERGYDIVAGSVEWAEKAPGHGERGTKWGK